MSSDSAAPARGDLLDGELGVLLARARRIVWAPAARELAERDESMVAYQVLVRLARVGPMTQAELAQLTGQHPAGVSRVLDDLETRKLVRRARDPNDRRKVRVVATAKGKARWKSLRPAVLASVGAELAVLSDDERHALRSILGKIVASHGEEVG